MRGNRRRPATPRGGRTRARPPPDRRESARRAATRSAGRLLHGGSANARRSDPQERAGVNEGAELGSRLPKDIERREGFADRARNLTVRLASSAGPHDRASRPGRLSDPHDPRRLVAHASGQRRPARETGCPSRSSSRSTGISLRDGLAHGLQPFGNVTTPASEIAEAERRGPAGAIEHADPVKQCSTPRDDVPCPSRAPGIAQQVLGLGLPRVDDRPDGQSGGPAATRLGKRLALARASRGEKS